MTDKQSVFLDLLYQQLLSSVISSLTRYHVAHTHCFDSVLAAHDSALIIQSTAPSHAYTITLPILESLPLLPDSKHRSYGLRSLQNHIKHFFSSSKPALSFFESHYFQASFIRSLTTVPLQSYQRLSTTQSPADSHGFLTSIISILSLLIQEYDTSIFWASSDHKRYLNRMLDKAILAQKSSTLDRFETFFSLIPTFLDYLNESSAFVYQEKTDAPDAFPDDFKRWNQFLNQIFMLFRAIVQTFLSISIYKLHYFTILSSYLSKQPDDNHTRPLHQLISELQSTLVYSLCFQHGLLADILSAFESLTQAHSSYPIETSSFSGDIKQVYFDVKHMSLDYNRSLKQLCVSSWIHYFSTCFSNQLSNLAIFLIETFYDVFPIYEFSDGISEHLIAISSSLNHHSQTLPLSIQDQTNPTIKVNHSTYLSLNHDVQSFYHLFFWSNLLSLYLSTQGRHSLLNECCILIHKKKPNSTLPSHLLAYISICLKPSAFQHYFDYLTQLYPKQMLSIINVSISLYPVSTSVSLYDDATYSRWYNSIQFLNRWIAHLRYHLFNSTHENWKRLYPYMSYHFLNTSCLVNDWIHYAATHPLERQCLTRMIHYISTHTSHDVALYNLFVRTKHITIDLPELKNVQLSYSLSESTLTDYLNHITFLYENRFNESLYAIDLLCFDFLDYCYSLHANYSANIVCHLLNLHLESLMLVLSIGLKHRLSSSFSFVHFLGTYYALKGPIYHNIQQKFHDYLAIIDNSADVHSLLQPFRNEASALSQPFFDDLIDYFSNLSQPSSTIVNAEPSNPVSQTYLSLQTHLNLPKTSSSLLSSSMPTISYQDPFYLIHDITPLLIDYYSLILDPSTIPFNLIEPKTKLEEWFVTYQQETLLSFNNSLSKSVKSLIEYALEGHHDRFLNQRSHLISLLFSLQSISFLQKLLLAHIINLSSCLFDLNSHDLVFLNTSLYVVDFDSISSKMFLSYCLQMYQHHLNTIATFSISEFDIVVLKKIFSRFKHLTDDLQESDLEFLSLFLTIIYLAIRSLPDHAHIHYQSLFLLLNDGYNYVDIIPHDSPLFKPCVYSLLPTINDLLEHGIIHYFHPFFNSVLSLYDSHSNPSEILTTSYTFLSDYRLLFSFLTFTKSINFDLFEAIIQKPYIIRSFNHIFSEMPGMSLNVSYYLLSHLHNLSSDDHDHGICSFLNHLFNQNLDLLKWQRSYFFFHLLKTFYSYSSESNHLDHMMGLSLNDHDKTTISMLLLKTPQQAKQLILRLQRLSQPSHPLLKNVLTSLIDHALLLYLNDPLLTLTAISNHSLKECLIIKSEIDQNMSHTFDQLNHLVSTFCQQPIRRHALQAFISKAMSLLKTFPSSSSVTPIPSTTSSHFICQLTYLLRHIDHLHSVLSDISHDAIDHLSRHICHVIARVVLDSFFVHDGDAASLDYLFTTHQPLFLDELKTIIIDQHSLSFQHIHSILALLQQGPDQLSYSRFSHWFIYLDILSYANHSDLIMILYECALIDPNFTLDIIKAYHDPLELFEKLIHNSPSIAFYLLYILDLSKHEADQTLFSSCKSLLSSHPFLSYLSLDEPSHHSAHLFLHYLYHPTSTSAHEISILLSNLFSDNLDLFSHYLELLFLVDTDLFWTICQYNNLGIFVCIIEFIQHSHTHNLTSLSVNVLSQCLSHPIFHTNLTSIFDINRYDSIPALLIHASMLESRSSLQSFTDHDLVDWLVYCSQFNHLPFCFEILKSRSHHSADCFFIMFFSSTPSSFCSRLLLDYLDYLDDTSLTSLIHALDEHYHTSKNDFGSFLLSSISSLSTKHPYSDLLLRCTPFLISMHNHASLPTYSDSSQYIISYATLCYVEELSIGDICRHLKQCSFIPSVIIARHIQILADAIFDSSNHHFLTDLSLHYPAIFKQLLFQKTFSHALQQAIYYHELTADSLLYNHIFNAIDSLYYVPLLHFLVFYSNKHLTPPQHASCHDLLDRFLPFSSDNVQNNFDELKTHYQHIINTPIPQLSLNDPILSTLYKKLPDLRHNLHITEQLYCFIAAKPQSLVRHGIDFSHVKKQLELCCSDTTHRLLFLSYLQHPSEKKSILLFSNFIENWDKKNSLYDTFSLYLYHTHEHQLLADYLLFMTRVITRFSFQHFKLETFKHLCSCLHFLLHASPDKHYLHQWTSDYLIPNMKASYFPDLAPIFSSSHIESHTIFLLATAFFHHHKTSCYAPLFKACFWQPCFSDIWENFILVSKQHVILSDLLVESSSLHMSTELFLRHFIEHQPKNLFDFCSIHYNHHIFIDIFFNKLFDYYFSNTLLEDTIASQPVTNAFIQVTQQALVTQETGFLFFLARCIEHYLIPNQKPYSWFIQLLANLYRICLSTLSHDTDASLPNTISKLFMNAGIILDTGEFLEDLPSLTLDQFSSLNPDFLLTPTIEFAFINLQQASIAHFQQRQHCLEIFIQEAPSFFIAETPSLSQSHSDFGITFFQHHPSYLDYLFTLLFMSGNNSLALKELFVLIKMHDVLKSKFYHYINQLSSDDLLTIITNQHLSIHQRHLILYYLLHDEKDRFKTSDIHTWENRVVNTLLSDLTSIWLVDMDHKTCLVYIEILLFFFIHFPTSLHTICTPHYMSIFNQTGICIPKIFSCKHALESRLFSLDSPTLSLDTLLSIMADLIETGFSLFDLVISFRASVFFNASLEKEWLSHCIETETDDLKSLCPSWFINIYNGLCPTQTLVYVPDSFFQSSVYHQAFKQWLLDEGHLDSYNILSLFNHDDFLKFYNPETVYTYLMETISTVISPKPIHQHAIHSLADPFFDKVFTYFKSLSHTPHIHFMECSVLLSTIDFPTTYYEKSFLLNTLQSLEKSLYTYQLASLLHVSYIPFILSLFQDSSKRDLCISKKENLIDSIPISLDLDHGLFDSLSKTKKTSFHTFLVDHDLIHNSYLNIFKLNLLKQDLSQLKDHYDGLTLLDKYIVTQKTLIESALTTIFHLGYILLKPFSIARSHFLSLFSSIHEHEWIYIAHFIKQPIDTISIESHLQSFISNRNAITKDLLKNHAITLRHRPVNTLDSESLFSDFQKYTNNYIRVPNLPTAHTLLETLMTSLSSTGESS